MNKTEGIKIMDYAKIKEAAKNYEADQIFKRHRKIPRREL